ncbi:RING finger protein 44 [Smittium culicis]|uniref:RING finger protein 44 n=1 Tax=Smittium culicis TaxID=133412 RepID=A0A1R1YPE7_9FUNG|nr:RING finger protein 44 [Smittium culicis]
MNSNHGNPKSSSSNTPHSFRLHTYPSSHQQPQPSPSPAINTITHEISPIQPLTSIINSNSPNIPSTTTNVSIHPYSSSQSTPIPNALNTNSRNSLTSNLNYISSNFCPRISALSRRMKLLLYTGIIFSSIRVLLCITTLALSSNKACDQPLKVYLALSALLAILNGSASLFTRTFSSDSYRFENNILKAIFKISEICNILNFIIFFLANFWLFSSVTCVRSAPLLFFVSLSLIIMSYFVLIIPLILLLCMIFCMPCVIHILSPVLQIPTKNTPAADSIINSIPLVSYTLNPLTHPPSSSTSPSTNNQYSQAPSPNTNNTNIHQQQQQQQQSIFVLFRPFYSMAYYLSRKRNKPFSQSTNFTFLKSNSYPEFHTTDDACCSICLGDYEQDSVLRLMVCGHHFHKECLDEWLKINRICPLCKNDCLGGPSLTNDQDSSQNNTPHPINTSP